MSSNVRLSVVRGFLPEQEFEFRSPSHCLIGRGEDCDIQVPQVSPNADISRHHCCLDIDPGHVWVHDLGSLNGTYVNGERIGKRDPDQEAEVVDPDTIPEIELADGDELSLALNLVFRVHISNGVGALSSPPPNGAKKVLQGC